MNPEDYRPLTSKEHDELQNSVPKTPRSPDYRQGALTAIYNLLDVIHANNNQVTIKDIEQFQEGQLIAQKEITNNPHPIAVSKEAYIAKAQEVAAIQDGQDFGWLDEELAILDKNRIIFNIVGKRFIMLEDGSVYYPKREKE